MWSEYPVFSDDRAKLLILLNHVAQKVAQEAGLATEKTVDEKEVFERDHQVSEEKVRVCSVQLRARQVDTEQSRLQDTPEDALSANEEGP
jgi:hypothetical protein